jgi:coiled-coil and C2 domain-containing protein 1
VQLGKLVLETEIPPAVTLNASTAPPPPPTRIEEEPLQEDLLAPSPRPHHKLQEPLKPTQATPPPPIPPRKVATPPPHQELTQSIQAPTPPPQEPPIDYNEPGQERLKEYKLMAVVLKRGGDLEGALNYLKLSKALESALLNSHQEVDLLEQFPPIIHENVPAAPAPINVSEEEHLQTAQPQEEEDLFHAPSAPTSILEALEQRLEKYKSEVAKAQESSNSSKARRMGRIVKQYEDAIGLYKKGKPVPYEDLPAPPGFGVIPLPVVAAAPAPVPLVTPTKPTAASASITPPSSIDRLVSLRY